MLSVLTLNLVRAAPAELLAGRVLTHDHAFNNNLVDVRSLRYMTRPLFVSLHGPIPRALLSNAGVSLVRTVPHVTHLNHVTPATSLRSLVSSPAHINHVSATAPRVLADTRVVSPVSHAVVVPQRVATPVILPEPEQAIPANYNFGYSVSDLVSGDAKTRQETREGDLVTGSYSVADPDGRIRTVTYTADSVHGFQAKVTYDGEEGPVAIPFHPPQSAPVLAPLSPAPAPSPPPPAPPAPVSPVSDDDDAVILARESDSAPAQAQAPTSTIPSVRASHQPLPLTNFFPRAIPAVPAVPAVPIPVQPTALAQPLVNVNSLSDLDIDNLLRLLRARPANLSPITPAVRTVTRAPLDLSQFRFLSNGEVVLH